MYWRPPGLNPSDGTRLSLKIKSDKTEQKSKFWKTRIRITRGFNCFFFALVGAHNWYSSNPIIRALFLIWPTTQDSGSHWHFFPEHFFLHKLKIHDFCPNFYLKLGKTLFVAIWQRKMFYGTGPWSCSYGRRLTRHKMYLQNITTDALGLWRRSVGKAVASNSRGPRFESHHQQKCILNVYCQLYWKEENKEKEAGNGPFLKKPNVREHFLKYLLSVCCIQTGKY